MHHTRAMDGFGVVLRLFLVCFVLVFCVSARSCVLSCMEKAALCVESIVA